MNCQSDKKGKRVKKRVLLALLLIVASLPFAAVLSTLAVNAAMLINANGRYQVSDGAQYDCILILGAGVRDNGTPSDMLWDRLETGLAMYEKGVSDVIIVSGDHGREEYDEVNTMKNWLMERGVPDDAIFMDHAGFCTYDSLVRAKEIFCCDSVCIVTQKYHLSRALYIADGTGLEAVGADAAIRSYWGEGKRQVREYAARCKDFLSVMLNAPVTYLGDTVSVFENSGSVTNDK